MRFDWKHKTAQDFIKDRVNREAFLEEPTYVRPLWEEPKTPRAKLTPFAIAALCASVVKNNLP